MSIENFDSIKTGTTEELDERRSREAFLDTCSEPIEGVIAQNVERALSVRSERNTGRFESENFDESRQAR